ncbi:hypothetical protein Moror_2688 [Moniliophthora roreri MCA 2997]|nr:hypothetical protein Moror_2688 [Moniliophthora roreri MCA 2997]
MTGLVGVVGAIAPGPVAVITIPIAGGLALAHWLYLVYQETPDIIRMLMAYIVDLTIIMQSLFWLTQARGDGHPVTKPLLRLAYAAYADCEEGASSRVHDAIQSFVTPTALFRIRRRDLTFDKIVELIHANRFTPSEHFKNAYFDSVPMLDDDQDFFADPLQYMDSHQTHE